MKSDQACERCGRGYRGPGNVAWCPACLALGRRDPAVRAEYRRDYLRAYARRRRGPRMLVRWTVRGVAVTLRRSNRRVTLCGECGADGGTRGAEQFAGWLGVRAPRVRRSGGGRGRRRQRRFRLDGTTVLGFGAFAERMRLALEREGALRGARSRSPARRAPTSSSGR